MAELAAEQEPKRGAEPELQKPIQSHLMKAPAVEVPWKRTLSQLVDVVAEQELKR